MRGAAGGDAIEIVIVVCAARATTANVSAPAREASSRDPRTSFDMGRLLVRRSGSHTAGEMPFAIAAMFELWSLCASPDIDYSRAISSLVTDAAETHRGATRRLSARSFGRGVQRSSAPTAP